MDAETTPRPPRTPPEDDPEARLAGLPLESETVFLRNYDPYRAYDLELAVHDEAGAEVFGGRYYFLPGQIESVRGALEPGEYEVTAVLDNRREKTVACTVDDAPEHTIHVEVGNGIVSVTQGLFG